MNDSVQSTRGGSCTVTVQNTRCLPDSEPGLYFIPDILILETTTSGNISTTSGNAFDDDGDQFTLLAAAASGDPDLGGGGTPVDPINETLPGGFLDFEVETAEATVGSGEVEYQALIAPFDTLAIHLIVEGMVLENAWVGDSGGEVSFQEINNTGSFGSVSPSPGSGESPTVLTEF